MEGNTGNTQKRMKDEQLQIETSTKKARTSRKVILNVGGTRFETTKETLLDKDTDSFFTPLFSGKFDPYDEDGSIFIDRDPGHFEKILSFLRSGHVTETDPDALMCLLTEAEFFQLGTLTLMIKKALGIIGKDGKELVSYEAKLEEIRKVMPLSQECFQYPLAKGEGEFTAIKSPEKWGFVTYDRVLTDCGAGTVIGEYDNDLWVHLDTAPGASRWKGQSREALVNVHGFRLLIQQT